MSEKKPNKIVQGFLHGLGFTVAFILVIFAAQYLYMNYAFENQVSSSMESVGWKEYSDAAGLVISDHSPIQTGVNFEVVGVVSNHGEDAWDGISIEVELFDKDGRFIDECSEYINSPIPPAGSENFKVSCGGCEKRPTAEFDHYEISIKDAMYERPRADT